MLRALDANEGRWDLSSLVVVTSSGVMWSEASKQGLLRHNPGMLLIDAFSSSEAIGLGQSVSSAGAEAKTAQFALGARRAGHHRRRPRREPGSGEIGRVAVPGHQPIGYYKDPEKSAATFITFDGKRYSMPGDYATVEADGTHHPARARLGVHQHRRREGLPRGGRGDPQDPPGRARRRRRRACPTRSSARPSPASWSWRRARSSTEAELIDHVKGALAHYKAPKNVLFVDTVGRAPNGKVDYKRMKAHALDELGIDA